MGRVVFMPVPSETFVGRGKKTGDDVCPRALLNNYMRQDRQPEAGKYKHNDAEDRVWIFDRHSCSLVRFGLRPSRKGFFTPQLLRFSFFLDRIVHLPVPSENVSRRGKKISTS